MRKHKQKTYLVTVRRTGYAWAEIKVTAATALNGMKKAVKEAKRMAFSETDAAFNVEDMQEVVLDIPHGPHLHTLTLKHARVAKPPRRRK